MSRYLLDTNIISNIVKPSPSESLMVWMQDQQDDELFIASLTIAEIRRGILEMPQGKRRQQIDAWFSSQEGPPALFAGRILSFDERAAMVWAQLMAESKKIGRSRSTLDTVIASVALVNQCTVVTDNERDFEGVAVVNPMRSM
ncbi:PIN domain-containing protein [soil metagenome]